MLSTLHLPSLPSSSSSPSKTLTTPSPNPPLYIKFRISHRENLRYLKSLGIINPAVKDANKLPPPDALNHILATVNHLKSKGISDADFPRLVHLAPQLFTTKFETADLDSVFDFLTNDLRASADESRELIVHCPDILLSNVEYSLKPTVDYLEKLGLAKLNVPSKLNAHLLNTRVEKLMLKMKFLMSLGLKYEEAARVCARMPALFGYSVEDNLRPKYEFLVWEMARGLEELVEFPQYFGFSLERRIEPRHWHLKERNVKIKLNRMLLWGDKKFYSKWK